MQQCLEDQNYRYQYKSSQEARWHISMFYGDRTYPRRPELMIPFRGANIRMSAVTTTVEWVFKLLLTKRCSKKPYYNLFGKNY